MNKYIRKLGFRSSDEMEMKVTIKSIKYSWIYTMVFIAAWAVLAAIDTSEIPMVHISLILTAELLFLALQWFFTKKEIKDSKSKHSVIKQLTAKGKGNHSYEYIYEDEEGNKYIYEEVDVEE